MCARLVFDDDDAEGGDLVDVGVLAQPACVVLDGVEVIGVGWRGHDIDGAGLGLEVELGLVRGRLEGLGGISKQLVDVAVAEEGRYGSASKAVACQVLEGCCDESP